MWLWEQLWKFTSYVEHEKNFLFEFSKYIIEFFNAKIYEKRTFLRIRCINMATYQNKDKLQK